MRECRTNKSLWFTRLFYSISATIALLGIAGWKTETTFLLSYIKDYPKMMPNTAISLMLGCASFFLLFEFSHSKVATVLGKALAVVVAIISGLIIYEYLAKQVLIVDSLPKVLDIEAKQFYGRPSFEAALMIFISSCSLIFFRTYFKKSLISQYISFSSIFIIQFFFIGYMTKASFVYSLLIPGHTGIALPTLLALLFLNMAFVAANSEIGFTSILFKKTSCSGVVIRTLTLVIFLHPAFLIFFFKYFQGIYYNEQGLPLAYSTTLTLFLFTFIIWRLATYIEQIDTKRTLVEEALFKSEQKYRGLLEAAGDAILITTMDGEIDFINDTALEWFEYSREEVIGKKIEMLVPERLRTNHINLRNEYMQAPVAKPLKGRTSPIIGRKKDGSEFHVEISLTPSVSEGKIFVTAMIRDITERRNKEIQKEFLDNLTAILNKSFEFEGMLNKLSEPLVGIFSDWCAINVGPLSQDIKYSIAYHRDKKKEEILKQFIGNIKIEEKENPYVIKNINPEEVKRLLSLNQTQFEQLSSVGMQSFISIPLIGRNIYLGSVLLVSSHHNFSNEEYQLALEMIDKVSLSIDNARLYLEAKKAVKSRENTLAIVSHDLRNPLSAIKIAIRSFDKFFPKTLADDETNARLKKNIDIIKRSSERTDRMINDLLDYAKIESGNLSLDKKMESLADLITEAKLTMDMMAQENHTPLIFSPAVEGSIYCDKNRLFQVLENLIGNAFKFSPKEEPINVNVTHEENDWLFSVHDHGVGMSEETAKHIFERYWQPEETRKQGTGLGLAIVKGIVEAHKGHIWVKTEKGKGSTFYFTIPEQLGIADSKQYI